MWKIYPESFYIEDFPYCPCCESKKKLVQTEWYPDELFKCPTTGTEIKLYNEVPTKLHALLRNLYLTYFSGDKLEEEMMSEFHRLKALYPTEDELQLARRIFAVEPFNKIPKEEVDVLFARFQRPHEIFYFLRRNYQSYRKYFRRRIENA